MPVADYEAAVREAFGDLADQTLALSPAAGDNALPAATEMNLDLTRYNLMGDAQAKMNVFTKSTYDAEYILTVYDDSGLGGFLELEPLEKVAIPAILDMLGK